MQNIRYCALFILFTCLQMMGMELALPTKGNKKQHCALVTNDYPAQKIRIPLELAMQCNNIKTMVEDLGPTALQESPLDVPIATSTEIVLAFISYLKKIDHLNKITKNQDLEIYQDVFSLHLSTFDTPQFIQLTQLVDKYEIIDKKYNNSILRTELAKRIRENQQEFSCLNNTPILCLAMKQICRDEQLDIKIIEPYAQALDRCLAIPRTEPILQNFKNNMYNLIHSQVCTPYYINLQTNTIIKSNEQIDSSYNIIKTENLCIYRSDKPTITISFNNIKSITNIEANSDESLFICKCKDVDHQPHERYYIIDSAHPEQPLPWYDICAFTENNDELYAVKGFEFGIFNIKTNTFTKIDLHTDNKVKAISTNNDKSIVALSLGDTILIGKKNANNELIFHPINHEKIDPSITADWTLGVTNICLHPCENQIYIETKYASSCCILDLETSNSIKPNTIPPFQVRAAHEIFFISDDILFLGYETGKDYFLNIRTGNHWTTNKPSGAQRIALSTDKMFSIEKTKKYVDGKETIKTNMRQIIDNTIIETVKKLNDGYYQLTLLTLAQQNGIIILNNDDAIYHQNFNPNIKTVLSTTRTITNSTLLARIQAPFRYIWPTVSYYGTAGAIFTASVVAGAIFTTLIKRLSNNKLKDNDVHNFLKGILWLAELAFK